MTASLHRWLLGALLVLVVAPAAVFVLVVVLGDESAGPDEDVRLERILEDPRRFLGVEVTVSGEVGRVGDRSFTLGARLDRPLLVTPADEGDPFEVEQGDVRRVVGTVRMVEADGRALGHEIQVDGPLAREFDGGPVIVARTVAPVPDDG